MAIRVMVLFLEGSEESSWFLHNLFTSCYWVRSVTRYAELFSLNCYVVLLT